MSAEPLKKEVRSAPALVVPKLGQPAQDALAAWNFAQVLRGERVLRPHPGLGLGRIRVLQPAIRIFDAHSLVGVNLIASAGGGIGHLVVGSLEPTATKNHGGGAGDWQ